MVSSNPLFRGGISLKKIRATVIGDVWPDVAFFAIVATGKGFVTVAFQLIYCWIVVAVVSDKKVPHHHNLGVSNQLLTVLGTVLGLVISFRTSSAYERWARRQKSKSLQPV
jgi:predicted membrane chloride channel (bestrophin family)